MTASNIACVPHSASATTRAWGNAERSPFITPGRPPVSTSKVATWSVRVGATRSSLTSWEVLVVGGSVGQIQTGPIDRDQTTAGQPAPLGVATRDRRRHLLEQSGHRLRTKPATGM